MFIAAGFSILVVMGLALVRALAGPTLYDRILAVNMFGTKTVLFISVLGFLTGRPDFLDIALVYALINFISLVAVLRFFEFGRFRAMAAPHSAPKENPRHD
ncbi:MAG: monovalent cation/H+ antiporter complex subunit F [Pseudomonadota bacterium]|nr:monovalent cation/H+ antiporter complex subunit F [Pseudomonadota bacterium]